MSSTNSKGNMPASNADKVCNKRKITASQIAEKSMSESDSELDDDSNCNFSSDIETETDDSCYGDNDNVQNTHDRHTNQPVLKEISVGHLT